MVNAPQPQTAPPALRPADPVTPLNRSRHVHDFADDDADMFIEEEHHHRYRARQPTWDQDDTAMQGEMHGSSAIDPSEYHRYNHMLNSFLLQHHYQSQQHLYQQQLLQSRFQESVLANQRQYYYTSPPHIQESRPAQPAASQSAQRRSDPHHRVYIINCAHCDTFLSNRGMRAVLLLKPHITLFSTDATPTNCGTLYNEDDEQPGAEDEKVERTCDCLTQSLGCHGCGNIVGYQIIAPCERCTASVAKHQRPANGHRYVFHHNEVVHTERKYYPGERGIRTDLVRHISHSERVAERERAALAAAANAGNTSDSSVAASAPPTPRMPQPTPIDLDSKEGRERLLPLQFSPSQDATRPATPMPAQRTAALRPPRSPYGLEEGDTVYWHYLVTGGELAKPVDPRTRIPTSFSVGR